MTELTDDTVKELSRTLFLVNGLHAQLANERDLIATSASQIVFSTSQFQKASEKFEEQGQRAQRQVLETVATEMKTVSKSISDEVAKGFVERFSSQVDLSTQKMVQTINQSQDRLSQCSTKIEFYSKWFITLAFGGAIVGGLIGAGITYYLTPKLDQQVIRKLEMGNVFEQVWPQLNQKDKEKLTALYTGKVNTPKK